MMYLSVNIEIRKLQKYCQNHFMVFLKLLKPEVSFCKGTEVPTVSVISIKWGLKTMRTFT